MLAYDYPVMGAFLTTLWLFLWIIWLIMLFRVIADIFRSDDMSGGSKALWMLFVVILPYLGVFIYLVVRGAGMGQRDLDRARAHEDAFKDYVQHVAGVPSTADELAKLAELRDRGVITDTELQAQKARLLA